MDSDVNIKRCTGQLPIGFAELEIEAIAEGHNHLTRLAAEMVQSPRIFHAMFACYVGETLAGIGAITDEPSASKSSSMWRMRRLYVRRQFRRRHIGRMIVAALLNEARQRASIVTVHAGNSEAPKFWEGIGFHRVANQTSWSHEMSVSGP